MRIGKRMLSVLLVLAMVFTVLPAGTLSAATKETAQVSWAVDASKENPPEVVPLGKKIKGLNKNALELKKGDTEKLKLKGAKAKKVKWKTSDPSVASVKKGKITAVGNGSATITATFKKKKYFCSVTVYSPIDLSDATRNELGSETVTAESGSAVVNDINFDFFPGAVEKDAVLTVSKVSGVENDIADAAGVSNVTCYDFSLEGASFDGSGENDFVKIQIPYKAAAGKRPVAGYIDPETGKSVSEMSSYNRTDGILTVYATHFSDHWVGELPEGTEVSIGRENTTRAFVAAIYGLPSMSESEVKNSLEEAIQEKKPGPSSAEKAKEALREIFGEAWDEIDEKISEAGDRMTLAQAFGLDQALGKAAAEEFGNFADVLGYIGYGISLVNAMGYYIDGNKIMGDFTIITSTGTLAQGLVFNWLGGGMKLAATSFAIGFIISKLSDGYQQTITANEKKWNDIYNRAYSTPESEGGYAMSDEKWVKELKPFFNAGLTDEEISAKIEAYVDKYVNRIFTEDGALLYWFLEEGQVIFGGLEANNLEQRIVQTAKKNLYDGIIKDTVRRIQEQALEKAMDEVIRKEEKMADELDILVTLELYDGAAKKSDSALEGYTVRLKNIPSKIEDPENLQSVLDQNGEGRISYKLWAGMYYGFATKNNTILELVDPKGEVVNEIRYDHTGEVIRIDVGGRYAIDPNEVELEVDEEETVYFKRFVGEEETIIPLKANAGYWSLTDGEANNKKDNCLTDCKVTKDGGFHFKGKQDGSAVLYVTYEGKRYECYITVGGDVDISEDEITINGIGNTHTLYILQSGGSGEPRKMEIDKAGKVSNDNYSMFDDWNYNAAVIAPTEGKYGIEVTAQEAGTVRVAIMYDSVVYYCIVHVVTDAEVIDVAGEIWYPSCVYIRGDTYHKKAGWAKIGIEPVGAVFLDEVLDVDGPGIEWSASSKSIRLFRPGNSVGVSVLVPPDSGAFTITMKYKGQTYLFKFPAPSASPGFFYSDDTWSIDGPVKEGTTERWGKPTEDQIKAGKYACTTAYVKYNVDKKEMTDFGGSGGNVQD